MPFPSLTGEQQISPEISIIGGDFFPGESREENLPSNISEINDELKGLFGGNDESIIFELPNETKDTMLERFLSEEGEKI